MNKILLIAVIVGIVALLAFGAFSLVKANTAAEKEIKSCSECQGKCTAENNCGLATCGAVNDGTCGCNKAR